MDKSLALEALTILSLLDTTYRVTGPNHSFRDLPDDLADRIVCICARLREIILEDDK